MIIDKSYCSYTIMTLFICVPILYLYHEPAVSMIVPLNFYFSSVIKVSTNNVFFTMLDLFLRIHTCHIDRSSTAGQRYFKLGNEYT